MMIQTSNTHRVGSITFGISMIMFGVLFLVHVFVPAFDYVMTLKLWPAVLIVLGAEVLAVNRKDNVSFVYDKTAILLTLVIVFFAICMSGVTIVMEQISAYYM